MYKAFRFIILFYLFFISINVDAFQLNLIQIDSLQNNSEEELVDAYGRLSPKGTINGFFKTIAQNDYEQAKNYFNFSNLKIDLDDSLSINVVKKFELVLNEYGKILPINVISNLQEGELKDGLLPQFETVGDVNYKGESIPIMLELVSLESDIKIWQFSSESINTILNEVYNNTDLSNELLESENSSHSKWNGAPIKDWLLNISLAIVAYLIAWVFTILITRLVRLFNPNFRDNRYRNILRTLLIPLRLVLMVLIVLNVSRYLGVSIIVRQAFGVFNLIAMWVALFVFIWLLIDTFTSFGEEKLKSNGQFGYLSAVSFFRNTIKFLLIVIALLIVFDTIGINLTAGIAALGVGGIALALGAQKTIENLIGGLSVVFDRPVNVGDFCKFAETQGTVEKIGMRSTRIRTSNRTVVTIPNSDFSSRLIENFSKRDKILFQKNLDLRYETTSNQLRFIIVELRKILYAHPKVDPNPARVRFIGFGSNALNIEINAYINTNDWNEYLAIQEDLNFRIIEVVEKSGSGFAFTSQTLYLSKDSGLSNEKRMQVEKIVHEWAENNELNLPEFDEKTISSLKGSLEYPMHPVKDNKTDED